MESAGPGVISIQGCDWGGNGGGPGGGGAGGTDDSAEDVLTVEEWEMLCPVTDPACKDRYIEDWTEGEKLGVKAAIDVMRDNGCQQQASYLEIDLPRLAIWDKRVVHEGDVIYGAYDKPTRRISFWSGYNKLPGDPAVDWTRTLAHEATHALFPALSDEGVGGVEDIAADCSTSDR